MKSKSLFITGTGTDIGKTYITGLIIKKLREAGTNPAYYKAAMSGNDRTTEGKLIPGDAVFVQQMAKIDQPVQQMCPYVYEHAYSPHLASRLEGNPVQMQPVLAGFQALEEQHDYITMEGSGGILCPLSFDQEKIGLEDVIKELNLSCLIIADAGLGTINSLVLTVEYMRAKQIGIKGIIFNHFHPGNVMEEDNLRMCESMTGLSVLACVKENDTELDIEAETLMNLYDERRML